MKIRSLKFWLMSLLSLVIYFICSAIGTLTTVVTLLEVSGTIVTVLLLCIAAAIIVKFTDSVMFFPLWTLIFSVVSAVKNVVTIGITLDNLTPENDPNLDQFVEIIGDVGTGIVVVMLVLWYILTAILKFVLPLIVSAVFAKIFRWNKARKEQKQITA